MQVSDTATVTLEHDQEPAFGVEFLNPVVLPVGHVDVPLPVQTDAPGKVELAFALARPAEAAEKSAVFGELLDAVVGAVYHEDVVVAVQGDARRPVQFSLAAAGSAPGGQEAAVFVEDRDAVQIII